MKSDTVIGWRRAALMALQFFVAFEIASVVANLEWHEISFELDEMIAVLAPAALIAAALWWRLNSQKSSG
ncbi:hypothetical protein D7D52_11195 [Nocardia yunnanensis]|uniref:Uncharacterized protein n=1 Tax=Nocardia yunnanensis TaxID=2382165 RepID=A0A386ZCI0_9NOCA|nr:hypothetical protein [Nocardia yunnanensis]AYF74335.1 hypothetical protein D7D52_11195 [Nocardia yunnanensis]